MTSLDNVTYESPKKKLKKNKKIKDDLAEDETSLNNCNTNEFNEESVTNIKKHKKKKDLSLDNIEGTSPPVKKKKKKLEKSILQDECVIVEPSLNNNTDEFNGEYSTYGKKHKKHKKNKDSTLDILEDTSPPAKKKKKKSEKSISQDECVIVEPSLNINNTVEFNGESATYVKKPKKHKKDKDSSLDILEDISPPKKKKRSEKFILPDGCDIVEPLVENCLETTNFTSNDTSNTNNYKNVKSENNFNEIQSHFYENKAKGLSNKYSEHKLEEKRTYYPDIKETVHLPAKGRHYTISIALPASILKETCLSQVLRTYVIGQLARAACIYSIDEIIVYNDQPSINNENRTFIGMMKMILEYQECPQYLRKDLFPIHQFLKNSGVLNALNAPHHLLAYQWCEYREGIVRSRVSGKCSYADIGLKSDILIDKKLEPGLRVTTRLPPEVETLNKMYGYVVSPDEPRIKKGMYWGYTVRVASCLSEVFKSDRFNTGYDLIIGTSDKGNDVNGVSFKEFSHALILFGGVQGLETAKEADETLKKSDIRSLCHHYVNVCPNQSSRTIRTEEAVLITLATLCPKLTIKGCTKLK
ncbi:putative methyltransferase [Armadillidium nasatum]|uniref:Putative methyltransferase n=1 Tax=Armadillidium nasatum TaxID=96803 RepID=A0A5N5SS89_9CRUS|nr:putative methyltransferase [Armadillidium nasatum]